MKDKDGDAAPQKAKKRPGRAPVSCAECRRLKMRCDRRHPCENCTRRGCAAICPDGTLTTGRHNRMVLTSTEELHERIETLCGRVRSLEDALRTLQANISSDPHPLLVNELSLPAVPLDEHLPHQSASHQQLDVEGNSEECIVDAFGTLSIGTNGETSFLGQTARGDYLLRDSDSDDEGVESGRLPREFYSLSWPEAPPSNMMLDETVLGYLPPLREAYALCEVYLHYGNWIGPFVTRDHLYHDLLAHVYHLPNHPWADSPYTCSHRLSLVFMTLALGMLLDREREPYNAEADDYYHLSRVALNFKSPVLETTVNAVLAIMHMSLYLELCDSQQGHTQGWVMLGIGAKLAFSMGLHRNSAQWKLDDEVSQRRHMTFWQLYRMESLASLQFGRPSLLTEAYIDCPLPRDPVASGATASSSYHIWVLQFIRLAGRVFRDAFGSRPPSYTSLLTLGREIREFAQPDWLDMQYTSPESAREPEIVKMQRWCALHLKETMLLHLHRSYLVSALSERPQDILKSKFSPSVKACYESAYRIIEGLQWIYQQEPEVASRMGSWLASAISSAIVMCLLVTRCPTSDLAQPSMEKLDAVCNILHKESGRNRMASRNLEATQKLHQQARSALDSLRAQKSDAVSPVSPTADGDGDLYRLGGKTRLVSRRLKTPASGGRGSVRSSITPERRMDTEGWDGQGNMPSSSYQRDVNFANGTSGWVSPPQTFHNGEMSRLSTADPSSYPPAHSVGQQGQLDPTWYSFVQQLGFGVP